MTGLQISSAPDTFIYHKRHLILTVMLVSATFLVQAQDDPINPWVEAGLNFQYYPAGFMISSQAIKNQTDHGNLVFRLGVNMARRQDFGEHDNEKGTGLGIGAGYRWYLKPENRGLFLQPIVELWHMKIDWIDDPDRQTPRKGKTTILILQPLVGAGYQYVFPNGSFSVEAGLAFGIEWNIITRGEEVGQGGISIGFISISKRF